MATTTTWQLTLTLDVRDVLGRDDSEAIGLFVDALDEALLKMPGHASFKIERCVAEEEE